MDEVGAGCGGRERRGAGASCLHDAPPDRKKDRGRTLRRMNFGRHDELQLLLLLAAIGTMLVVSVRSRLPLPVYLVVGGLVLSFVPGAPTVQLPPNLVLVAILPPLLYSSAFFTGLRDLRANMRPISLLAFGLVAATTVGIAVVAHAVIAGFSWPSAFVLGAVLSPTDPLAAARGRGPASGHRDASSRSSRARAS